MPKKEGGLHPCIDSCGLTQITVHYQYSLPLVISVLEQFAAVFTKPDLRNAYNLIRVCEGDELKTAYSTKDIL